MAGPHKIETPRGTLTEVKHKNGRVSVELEWNEGFGPMMSDNVNKAQQFVDSEVLRLCDPLVPMQTGMLKKSGTLGTDIGSGEVNYIAPYAAMQYYNTAQTRDYDSNRGAYWFERMKASHKKEILEGAKKLAGGG